MTASGEERKEAEAHRSVRKRAGAQRSRSLEERQRRGAGAQRSGSTKEREHKGAEQKVAGTQRSGS